MVSLFSFLCLLLDIVLSENLNFRLILIFKKIDVFPPYDNYETFTQNPLIPCQKPSQTDLYDQEIFFTI